MKARTGEGSLSETDVPEFIAEGHPPTDRLWIVASDSVQDQGAGRKEVAQSPRDEFIPEFVNQTYGELTAIMEARVDWSDMILRERLQCSGFCAFECPIPGDGLAFLPIHVSSVGIGFLRNGQLPRTSGLERRNRFVAFPHINFEGETPGLRVIEGVIHGFTPAGCARLKVLTEVYLERGYIREYHLSRVMTPDGERSLYVDAYSQTACEFPLMAQEGTSLRVIKPNHPNGDAGEVTIIDEYDDAGNPASTRSLEPGELPVHSQLPESLNIDGLPANFAQEIERWIVKYAGQEGIGIYVRNGVFFYRRAFRELGLALRYEELSNSADDEGTPRGRWVEVVPHPVLVTAEFSQLAKQDINGAGKAGSPYMKVALRLLIPLAHQLRVMGAVDYVRDETNGGTIAFALSAVPKVAQAMESFASGMIGKVAAGIECIQLGPCSYGLGSPEVPMAVVVVGDKDRNVVQKTGEKVAIGVLVPKD